MAQEPDIDQLEVADELIAERRAGNVGDTPEDMRPWMRWIRASPEDANTVVASFHAILIHMRAPDNFL